MMEKAMRKLVLALAFALFALPASAQQDYPNKDIHVIIGFAGGTGADVIARYYASKLAQVSGRATIVENKPGAFGNIGAAAAVQARPDGYTVLITPSSTQVLNPHILKQVTFDSMKDLTPVGPLHRQAFILVVDAKKDIKSVADLTRHLKNKPGGKNAYGAPNAFSQICAETYKQRAGVAADIVRYQSTPPAVTEMLDGQLDFIFADATFALEQIKAGRIRGLAVTMGQRAEAMPDLPTMQEAGVPDFELMGWFAVYVPAKTPQPIVAKLSGWVEQIVRMEETKKFLFNMGNEPMPGNAEALDKFQKSESVKWERLIKAAKIEPM
jgi:tripartite-type tricarboxylate transporter receptor subunit TctC